MVEFDVGCRKSLLRCDKWARVGEGEETASRRGGNLGNGDLEGSLPKLAGSGLEDEAQGCEQSRSVEVRGDLASKVLDGKASHKTLQ